MRSRGLRVCSDASIRGQIGMFDLILSGGTVVNAEGALRSDVAIVDGRVAGLLSPGEPATARTIIDVSGRHVLPGLVDAHAHLREPGLTHKEDFESGTAAAALGGVTTVLDMPTDDPWTATPAQLCAKMALAAGRIHVDVGFQVVVSHSVDIEAFEALRPVSFELFTADVPEKFLFPTLDAVSEVLGRFANRNTLVGVSPGDQSILIGSAGRDRTGDIAAFLASRPPLAEANGIARAVLAASSTGARIHIRQINSGPGIETWRRLRDLADATVETTPQNLFFAAGDYASCQGAKLKGSPPFRTKQDVETLRFAMRDGLIDIVATDHAPHSPEEKSAAYPAFADIPGGMPGLQTLLQLMLKLVGEEVIGLADLVRMCARNPATRFGLGKQKGSVAPGYDADLLIVDRGRTGRIANEDQASKGGYTPFDGWDIPARLERVFLRGHEIMRHGRLTGAPCGLVVRRCS